MEEPLTCGQGLAGRSVLHAKVGELLISMAQILAAHMRALDPADADAKQELDAYAKLATEHREIAGRLSAVAEHMAGYRGLPIAPHNIEAMSDATAQDTFETFVHLERELAALVREQLQQDESMLREMPN